MFRTAIKHESTYTISKLLKKNYYRDKEALISMI